MSDTKKPKPPKSPEEEYDVVFDDSDDIPFVDVILDPEPEPEPEPEPTKPPPAKRRAPKPARRRAPEPDEPPPPPVEDDPDRPGCFGRLTALFGIVVVLVLIGAGVGYLEFRTRLMPVSDKSKKIDVTIPKGANVTKIAALLEAAGVIRSADAFKYYVRYKKAGSKLKAGEQVLDAGRSTPEVVADLIRGSFKLYPVTVPEGLTIVQIADVVAKAGLADRDEFIRLSRDKEFIKTLGFQQATLEGYLFPETYNFSKGDTTRDVLKAMVDRFWTVWERYRIRAGGSPLNRHEIITLASIVEKETGAAMERPIIAAVFLNRLRKGMRLETDPTVIYGIKDFDGNLTKKHLQTPTPYNTYLIEGLPPGPIASPGEASIKAVLNPENVEYLYFVSKNDGTHFFSKTLTEHNQAVRKYQKSLKNSK